MNRVPMTVAALIAGALRPEPRATVLPDGKVVDPLVTRAFHKRGGGNRGRFTRELLKRQREKRLERFGLDVKAPDGRPDPENLRAMRRARKQERQLRG